MQLQKSRIFISKESNFTIHEHITDQPVPASKNEMFLSVGWEHGLVSFWKEAIFFHDFDLKVILGFGIEEQKTSSKLGPQKNQLYPPGN